MNNKTARIILQADHEEGNLPRGKSKRNKRKNKIDRSIYCAELENVGRHIFDIDPLSGKHNCRYCGMEDPAMSKPVLELV